MKKYFLFILILILFSSFCYSAKEVNVQTSTGENELKIVYPKIVYLEKNKDFIFNTCVYNASGLIKDNTTTLCRLCLTSKRGEVIVNTNLNWDGQKFTTTIDGLNFSEIGEYAYNINCNNTITGGFASGEFLVTKTGLPPEYKEDLTPYFFGFLLIIIILLFMFLLAYLKKEDD